MFSIIQAAGWPIWPLLAASVFALALIVERLLSLRPSRIAPSDDLKAALVIARKVGTGGAAPLDLDQLAERSILGRVISAGLKEAARSPAPSLNAVREAFENAGRAAVHEMERHLNALGTVATAAPLMGLLGTVVGMIEIFAAQSPGTLSANPQQLAQGISIALYNTAFGLIVAIPALLFHRYFRGVIEDQRLALEMAAHQALRLSCPQTP